MGPPAVSPGPSRAAASGPGGALAVRLGAHLAGRREAAGRTLAEVAAATRIPERSLALLERGAFEALPGDVFVRGFLRSYAGCLGLDADELLRRYARCGRPEAPVATPDAHAAAAPAPAAGGGDAGEGVVRIAAAAARPSDPLEGPRRARGTTGAEAAPPATRPRPDRRRRAQRSARATAERRAAARQRVVAPAFAPPASRRGLVVAVALLAISALVTMSFLLQPPG